MVKQEAHFLLLYRVCSRDIGRPSDIQFWLGLSLSLVLSLSLILSSSYTAFSQGLFDT